MCCVVEVDVPGGGAVAVGMEEEDDVGEGVVVGEEVGQVGGCLTGFVERSVERAGRRRVWVRLINGVDCRIPAVRMISWRGGLRGSEEEILREVGGDPRGVLGGEFAHDDDFGRAIVIAGQVDWDEGEWEVRSGEVEEES